MAYHQIAACNAILIKNLVELIQKQKSTVNQKVNDISVCTEMLGRVIDAFGNPIDGKGPINPEYSKESLSGLKLIL